MCFGALPACMSGHLVHNWCLGNRRGVGSPWNCIYNLLWARMWVLGIKLSLLREQRVLTLDPSPDLLDQLLFLNFILLTVYVLPKWSASLGSLVTKRGQTGGTDKCELWKVGVGNPTWVLQKTSHQSQLLSHLSSPHKICMCLCAQESECLEVKEQLLGIDFTLLLDEFQNVELKLVRVWKVVSTCLLGTHFLLWTSVYLAGSPNGSRWDYCGVPELSPWMRAGYDILRPS